MFKSKIVYALSLSFLVNVSHLPLAHAGRTKNAGDHSEEDKNPRHQKAQKAAVKKPAQSKTEQKMRKLREAKEKIVTKVRAHNADFPEPAQTWGVGSQNVWAVVGSHIPLDDFFRLFSCNNNFLALGENLIQQRSHKRNPHTHPILLNVPFNLSGQFQRRKFSISYLMRCDLSHVHFCYFRDVLQLSDSGSYEEIDNSINMSRRAAYYTSVHPLMASYCNVLARLNNDFYLLGEVNKAKETFQEHLSVGARALDPLAIEMLMYSQLVSGHYHQYNLLASTFPSPAHDQNTLRNAVLSTAFEQSPNPAYVTNLCRFVSENEERWDDIETNSCSAWKCVGIPLLNHTQREGNEFSAQSRRTDEGVVLGVRIFKDKESASQYFMTNKLHNAQRIMLKYLANTDYFCPSMRILEGLVQNAKFSIKGNETEFFYPPYLEEVERYLGRLLSFGERGDEFQKYDTHKFNYLELQERHAAKESDSSLARIDAIKNFALENLLALYLQKGEQDKAKEIAKKMTKDRTGASYFAVGSICESLGRERFAVRYYRDALLNGENKALYPLWRCVTKVLNVDEKMIEQVTADTEPTKILWNLAHLFYLNKKHEDALVYLKYGCTLAHSGMFDYGASTICFKYGDADAFNYFIESAAVKGHTQALKFLEEAKEHNMTPFERVNLLREKKKAETSSQ